MAKIHGSFFLKIREGAIFGDFVFIPAPTTNVSTSLKILSLGPLFLSYDYNSMFVGVFSEMLREKYAGDMVNFNYDSPLDVRNFYKLIQKNFFIKRKRIRHKFKC